MGPGLGGSPLYTPLLLTLDIFFRFLIVKIHILNIFFGIIFNFLTYKLG